MATNPTNMSEQEFSSYLAKHGISGCKRRGDEISFSCPFSDCDDDHRNNEEFHCGFNLTNCTYNCFKCGAKGNFITLLKHFGDYEDYISEQKAKQNSTRRKRKSPLETMVQNAHDGLSDDDRSYFHNRGINNESIDRFMLGATDYNGQHKYVIPIYNRDGEVAYVKLRSTKAEEPTKMTEELLRKKSSVQKYMVAPTGSELLLVGEDELISNNSSNLLIVEGEFDRIITIQEGVKMPVVTGGGAPIFKKEWIETLTNKRDLRNIYICFDRDETGEKATNKLAHELAEYIPSASIYNISLPFEENTKADLTDYFVQKRGTADELFSKYAKFCCGREPIDPGKFKEITLDDVAKVLDLTIKHDYANKLITFLAMLTTYTEKDQLNIYFSARSATGKTFITREVSKLFPRQDVKPYTNVSPNSLYYNQEFERVDKKTGRVYIDLERKILILLDMPNPQFLERVRGLLSHDEKECKFSVTNKGKNGRNCADDRYLLGFPSVFFCSASMKIDEQEQTRCIILSPEVTQEKLKASLDAAFLKGSDEDKYRAMVESDPDRKLLKDRILFIKNLEVKSIKIPDEEYSKSKFLGGKEKYRTDDPRKSQQYMGLVKAIALLNAPLRMVNDEIRATKDDIDQAAKLWRKIEESTSYGVPPQALATYKNDIVPIYIQANKSKGRAREDWEGITVNELCSYYLQREGVDYPADYCKRNFIPALEDAGLITYEQKKKDKRKWIITPLRLDDSDMEEKA